MQEATRRISQEEYLVQEADATIKSEYYDGAVVAMAGAQTEHNLIVANLVRLLGNCAIENNCDVFPSDMLLSLPSCSMYVYPDVMMVCGKKRIERKAERGLDALLNPSLIVEVSSPSTEQKDQIAKRDCYFELESLNQYVLIDSQKKSVWVYTRNGVGSSEWLLNKYQSEDKLIELEKCQLLLKDIYRSTDL